MKTMLTLIAIFGLAGTAFSATFRPADNIWVVECEDGIHELTPAEYARGNFCDEDLNDAFFAEGEEFAGREAVISKTELPIFEYHVVCRVNGVEKTEVVSPREFRKNLVCRTSYGVPEVEYAGKDAVISVVEYQKASLYRIECLNKSEVEYVTPEEYRNGQVCSQ